LIFNVFIFVLSRIFHLAITLLFQYWLMRDLEKLAGAKRTGFIYLASGMVGNLASAIFVPNRAEVGPAGAHFGLLAAAIVEVIHQWPSLKYPEMAILKLVGVTAVLFLAGLLPWIDNYAHLFGFITGFLLAYAMLPFVTFGVYGRRRKVAVVWICTVLALVLFVGLILLFYVSPIIQDCEICKYFNCIPITKDFCSEQNIDLGTEV
jgi:membrane associated rhomboid family serine protease